MVEVDSQHGKFRTNFIFIIDPGGRRIDSEAEKLR